MLKQLVILRSLPGAGKSYIAKEYQAKYTDSCFVFSTDDYWMRPDGVYDFNYELLSESHRWNQKRVEIRIKAETNMEFNSIIIVDNTNITFNEMKPYIKLAIKYGFEVKFVEPDTKWRYDVEECFKRNTHGVPYTTILKMSQRWEDNERVLAKLQAFVER